MAGAAQLVQDRGELADGPRVRHSGGDSDPDLAEDRRANVEAKAGVERPDAVQPPRVGALLHDRRQQVRSQARGPGDTGIERLELSRPRVVVEVRAVEV